MKNEKMILDTIQNLSNRKDATTADNAYCLDLLRRFLTSNAATPSNGKFDLFKYTGKDQLRPVMTGIYHDNGARIATDANILAVLAAQDYPAENEGKIIDAKAAVIDGRFPDYNRVAPRRENLTLTWTIDRPVLIDAIKIAKQRKKESKWNETFVVVKGTAFNPDYLLKLIDFAAFVGTDTIHMDTDPRHAAMVYGGASWGLLMPVLNTESDDRLNINLTPENAELE